MRFTPGRQAAALLGISVLAQAAPTDPPSTPSVPSSEFARLITFFSGQWDCTGHFANGNGISSSELFNPLMNGAWLQQIHDDHPPYGYHAYSMWGVDKQSQDLVVTIHDLTGGVRLFRSSHWHESSFTLDSQPFLGRGESNERFTFERKGPGDFTYAYSIRKAPGEWVTGDQLECTQATAPGAQRP
jgi:hypothetical protein